ncbi:rRNA maturation RNase YbeY [Zhaonella formicivorans]|uniref:rRNA maturation RNase YbeY n=1 Tax=Zhaonella formicivorans TaxID=2528593 RepID=UPI0010CE1D97|nr:rRNA maturation RNase YbeY [Zhaonella formicivorans]
MQLLVSNQQDKVEFTRSMEEMLTRVVQLTLEAEGENPALEVSLLLVDDAYIHQLNREYRGIDRPTDVLSFALREETGEEPHYLPVPEDNLLGDIIISLETAARQAIEYGHSLDREMAYLAVHGCLHLLGYDHETEEEKRRMREKEEKILEMVGQTR